MSSMFNYKIIFGLVFCLFLQNNLYGGLYFNENGELQGEMPAFKTVCDKSYTMKIKNIEIYCNENNLYLADVLLKFERSEEKHSEKKYDAFIKYSVLRSILERKFEFKEQKNYKKCIILLGGEDILSKKNKYYNYIYENRQYVSLTYTNQTNNLNVIFADGEEQQNDIPVITKNSKNNVNVNGKCCKSNIFMLLLGMVVGSFSYHVYFGTNNVE